MIACNVYTSLPQILKPKALNPEHAKPSQVRRIVYEASYLVLGLGDVYLGAPCAVPVNPLHRLVTTKVGGCACVRACVGALLARVLRPGTRALRGAGQRAAPHGRHKGAAASLRGLGFGARRSTAALTERAAPHAHARSWGGGRRPGARRTRVPWPLLTFVTARPRSTYSAAR